MKNDGDLRVSLLNGYNKKDVDAHLAALTAQMAEAQREKALALDEVQSRCEQLEMANQALDAEKKMLQGKLEDYTKRKDALAQVEVDARLRAQQMMADTQEKLKGLETSAQKQLEDAFAQHVARCDDLRAQLVDTVADAMTIQGQITELLTAFGATNQRLQADMAQLQKVMDGEDETALIMPVVEAVEVPSVEWMEQTTTGPTVAEMFQQIIKDEEQG